MRANNWRERAANWLAPALGARIRTAEQRLSEIETRQSAREAAKDNALRKSLDIADRLEMRLIEESEEHRLHFERKAEILGELDAAIALADGSPWLSPNGRQRESAVPAAKGLIRAREAVAKTKPEDGVALRETVYGMAELELALEDRGWKRLIAQSQYEFSRFGIQSIILICRLYYIKNPLARRGVDVSAFYIFGRGMEISSPDDAANQVLQAFFQDPRNATQFSHTALVKAEKKTYTDGNVFWAFFPDPEDGRLETRALDAIEISDIICDPNDADTPWFYRREWQENIFDMVTGKRLPQQRTAWYFALGWEGLPNFPRNQRMIEEFPVMMDSAGQPIPVLHVKDGELPGWRFGCPRMYPAIDWLRAYRHVLEDLCTTWRALARFAWNVEVKGGAPAIAAFKQTLATTFVNDLSSVETNPPPVTGSAFITSPSNKMTPVQAGGNTTMNPDNARRVLLMVCSAFGLAENLFGDATTGSLATAASLERPTELMFLERQEVWRETLQRIGQHALSRSLAAPKGKLREAYAERLGVEPSEIDPLTVLAEIQRKEAAADTDVARADEAAQVNQADKPPGGPSNNLGKYLHPKGGKKSLAKKSSRNAAGQITINVSFPDILAHDITSRIDAIVSAATLGNTNGQIVGIDERTTVGLALAEFGVEDVQAVVEAMYPEDEYDPSRMNQEPPEEPPAQPGVPNEPPEPNAPPPPSKAKTREGISSDPAKIDRAVQLLIEAARRNLQKAKATNA